MNNYYIIWACFAPFFKARFKKKWYNFEHNLEKHQAMLMAYNAKA